MTIGEVFEEFNFFGVREEFPGKRCIVGAGLKMYLSYQETIEWLEGIKARVGRLGEVGVFVLPTFPALGVAQQTLAGTGVLFGAQDTHWEERGPFTGEVSPLVLRELGCTFIEIGHSERREMFGETDECVQRKTKAVLKQGLIPLICVGERTKQPTDLAIDITIQQLREALGGASTSEKAPKNRAVVIAYEPVWAIGVDQSAPVDHIEPVVAAIREELFTLWSGTSAILYGGSVNPNQAEGLIQTGVDGLFIGRAALNIDHFFETIFAVANRDN
jgi:triosephosphate isomerase